MDAKGSVGVAIKARLAGRREMLAGMAVLAVLAPLTRAMASIGSDDDTRLAAVIDELVAANRILESQGILDAFGHVSARHPTRPDHFLLSRSRAPGLVVSDDIMEFDAAGIPVDPRGRSPYVERFIHAAVYAARPDVRSVVHDHSREVIPFSVVRRPLRPTANNAGAFGAAVPVWDIRRRFGDATANLVTNLAVARDLAATLGEGAAVLMRGHGAVVAGPSIRLTVSLAIELASAATIELDAIRLGGPINHLSAGEIKETSKLLDPGAPGGGLDRAWEYWCKKAGVPFIPQGF